MWSLLNQVQCTVSVHSLYAPERFCSPEFEKYIKMFASRQPGRSYGSGSAAFVMQNFPAHPVFPTTGSE